jgi:hypothetical protein
VSPRTRTRALAVAGIGLMLFILAEWACHKPGEVATIGSDQRLQWFARPASSISPPFGSCARAR